MSQLQIKKSLRRTIGTPKSYAEIEVDQDVNQNSSKRKEEKDSPKESIFEHKNWAFKEKVRLMVFFSFYKRLPDWCSERRSIHLYKHLSAFLKGVRTPQQCKNIHSFLKRKFNSLDQIIQAMQDQLQPQENYQKNLIKYQLQIQSFQKQRKLANNLQEENKYEPIKLRRIPDREEFFFREKNNKDEIKIGQSMRDKKENDFKFDINPVVKCEDGASLFAKRKEELLDNCNYYFRQWLQCTLMLEHRRNAESKSDST